jgi:hypothetical protein
MKKILSLLIIFIIFYGCKKDNSYEYSSNLIGKWSWLRTCGGFIGCTGPEDQHISINVVFTADSIYNNFLNDTLRVSGRFYTLKILSAAGKDSANVIIFDNGARNNYSILHDTLALSNAYSGSLYRRIK